MKNKTLLVAILLLASSFAQAQNLSDDPAVSSALHLLERWVDAQRAYQEIPGLSIAVVHDQELLWSDGFGHADLEQELPATAETIYSICSVSKLFTSIGVLQLRDAGHFELDDSVSTLLPWFEIEQQHPESPAVTVEGLLTHSAGLPRESDYPYWSGPDFPFPEREQIIERVSAQQTLYPASTYFQYSNLGLTLAGELVAEASGQPYAAYVQEHVLDSLGLKDTKPEVPEPGGRLATGYSAMTRKGTRDEVAPFQARGIAPAAGFASTVEDLARFASWQFRLLEEGGEEVLKANTLREMHRVHWLDPGWDTSWGLGFAVFRANDQTVVGHGGSCPGYRTAFQMQPKNKLAAIVMANANGVDTGAFASQAFSIVGPAVKKALAGSDSTEQSKDSLDLYTGTYSLAPWWGELEVLRWEDGLAMVSFPTENPKGSLAKLKHVEGHTFRRVRDDGELGEEVVFEVGSDGQVTHVRQHSNPRPKISASSQEASAIVKSGFIYEQASFPSAHASTIVESGDGLVAAWFGGTDEGEPDVGIWTARYDGSEWSEPVEVANGVQPDGTRHPSWNPVLFQPSDGPLLLFYKVGPNPREWWGLVRTSSDHGQTWSKEMKLPEGILGPIRAKPVGMEDGTLLAGSSTEHDGWIVHMERFTGLDRLADAPETLASAEAWQKTGPLNSADEFGAIQPTILVHSPDTLQILNRSRQQAITQVWSTDGGETWGPMTATDLPNPSAGIDAVRLDDGRFLLIYNPVERGRHQLAIAVSEDGKDWQHAVMLEDQPGEYSYPTIIQTEDGEVHVTYTWRRERIKHVVLDPERL